MSKHYVILGGGIAGFTAAGRIRELEADAVITLLTAEKELPYIRPLLSKTWFRSFRSSAALLASEEWYHSQRILVRTNCRVEKILTESQKVCFYSGDASAAEEISYDACIYALGAESMVPSIPGLQRLSPLCAGKVLTLRSASDFDRIRRRVALAKSAIVIGGGVVGMETAWELSRMELQVTVLESAPHILGHQLDPESARYLTQIAASRQINCLSGVKITEITEDDCSASPSIHLADGQILQADLVILSCGIRPSIAVAQASGINCRRGLLVDDCLRTSAAGVYAAGDCIEGSHPNPGLWTYALRSALTAATNAVNPASAEVFRPKAAPVILNCLGCSIFSYGDFLNASPGSVPGDSTRVDSLGTDPREATREAIFEVNPHDGEEYRWEKLFYRNGRLCGVILIGDLRRMNELRAQIDADSEVL